MSRVKIGLIGSQFAAEIHAESLKMVPDAEVVAVASPTESHVRAFASKHAIPYWFTDYRKLLEMEEIRMVALSVPNDLHCPITMACASADKHVVVEKPFAMNLREADLMIDACRKAGVLCMYAEELCFTPKYVRVKQLADEGAFGRVYLVKQSEKHGGPHAAWFWDVRRSGGGVTMDMGCHAIEFFRWFYGKPKATSVFADMGTFVHSGRTKGDDNATIIVRFENGAAGLAEESWARAGGMDDRVEVFGSDGCAYANLHMGNAIQTYSEKGYGYVVEKATSSKGWTYTTWEEIWNYGFPQEMAHFVDCVKNGKQPLETGEDGRAVLELVCAAYASAGRGRRIELPFRTDAERPIDLWLDSNTARPT
ncbi:MAG: Gfo/Idh/MocA family oxidoreductase [Acidobacteria bacterium]|nr:Gfo/Idh/MocA family oxidoreductase [Acidobacteriota bacterium]